MHVRGPRAPRAALWGLLASGVVVSGLAALASCASPGKGTNQTFDSGTTEGGTEADSSAGGGDAANMPETIYSGCDANPQNDPYNCGSCGHRCDVGQICSGGTCIAPCTGALTACNGSCVDTTKDPNNCGQCQNQCLPPSTTDLPATPVCVGGACTFTCAADAGADGGADGGGVLACQPDSGAAGCFDPSTSAQACGGCGRICASGKCAGGVCQDAGAAGGNYTVSNPVVPFVDACSLPGHTAALSSQSGWSNTQAIDLPFSFMFYGSAVTQFWLGSQGTLGFGPPSTFPPPSGYPDCTNGTPFTAYAAAVVFGDMSLATGSGGICYADVAPGDGGAGDAGGDAGPTPEQLVVTWHQATDESDPGSVLTFSVVLTQGTNTLDFVYGTMSGADGGLDPTVAGGTATVGIQNNGATMYKAAHCAAPFITSTPYDVRFTPQ